MSQTFVLLGGEEKMKGNCQQNKQISDKAHCVVVKCSNLTTTLSNSPKDCR